MTSSPKNYPTRVKVNHNEQVGWIALDQIRTIDKVRIIKTFNPLTTKEIERCKKVLKELLVD